MDNLTHSLVGVLLGEATHDLGPDKEKYPKRRPLLLTASLLANNFPDLDSLYTRIMPPPLGYLLHHRGHTHTLLLLIPQIILIFGILLLIPRFRRQLQNKQTLKLTSIVVLFGLLIHMMLDSWNSYGIHPFYPLTAKWFYGDLVFIIEPFLWFSFAIPVFFLLKSKWVRLSIFVLISGIPIMVATKGLLSWYSVASVFSFALIAAFFIQQMKSASIKVLVGVFAALLFLATQTFTAAQVRKQLHNEFTPLSPQHHILDLVLNPMPANPFCWSVLQLEADAANDKYITQGKIVSSWPSILPATSCVIFREPAPRAEYSLSQLSEIVSRDCHIDAWLRFTRAPFIEGNMASDLRFSQREERNFSSIEIADSVRECPRFIPPWSRPRQDLLNEAEKVAPIKRAY